MQVNMPAARRLAQLPERYADGGAVGFGARGLNQLRELVPKVAAMGYPQQAQAPAPAPVSDPRSAQLMAMIPQMEAMGFKQKPQMLARGGMVRGPGTGTSDSIPDEVEPDTFIMPADSTAAIGPDALEKLGTMPVRLSDGEFKIPPEQVMALGAAVLKLLKDTTHTPVNGVDGGQTDAEVEDDDEGEDGARGFNPADRMAQMPEQMYADGGSVGFQRVDVGQWAQDQDQWRDDLARFDARQAKARQDQEDADEEARRQVEAAKMRSGQSSQADQSAMTFADGGLVESNVTRVGNSYSGGNVGGNITVNGRAPNGGYMGASNSAAGGQSPSPVGMSVDQAQSQGLIGGRVGYNPAYDQRLNGTNPAARPAPTTISVTRATPAVGTQDPAAGFASPVDRMATAPAPAPMGWQARQDQRSADVSSSSITNRPEWRRYADGGMVEDDLQKRLMQIPSSAPAGWNGGGANSGGATGSWEAPQAAPAPAPTQPAGALSRAASMSAPAPAAQAMGTLPNNAVTRTGNSYTGADNISGDITVNGQAPGGGAISAQNMAAADSLARRGAADAMASMPAPQQTTVQAPMVRHSGNDWQARNDLRNALVSASSITNNGGRFDQTRGRNPAALAYQSALATDNALQASEPGLAAAAMKENSETNRSAMRERGLAAQALASERGAMDRTLIAERGANARTGLTTQATLDAAKIKAQQEMAEQQRKAALKNPETSTALRKEFEGLPEVKNYKQALPAYKGIEDAVKRNTPMSDINIVYGIAKLYDPNSVVREGEYATVANAPNIPERVKGWVQYATNGGKLTPEVKKQIMDEASSRMMSFQNEFEGSSARYRDIAERSNADPTLVISSDYKPAVAKKEEQAAVPPQIAELQRRAASNPALAARLKEMGY